MTTGGSHITGTIPRFTMKQVNEEILARGMTYDGKPIVETLKLTDRQLNMLSFLNQNPNGVRHRDIHKAFGLGADKIIEALEYKGLIRRETVEGVPLLFTQVED